MIAISRRLPVLPPSRRAPQKRGPHASSRNRNARGRRSISVVETSTIALLVMCVHVAGCAFNAHEIDPRPAPRATRSTHALVVQVDEAIADDFLLEEELGAPALSVRGFRRALVVGLERARDGAFAAPKDGTPAWRLVVVEARPRLVPQDYDEHGKAVLFTAELAYRAVLFDPLMQQAGERTSLVLVPGSFRGVSDGSPLIARAIELVADETMAFVDEEIARATAGGAPTPEK